MLYMGGRIKGGDFAVAKNSPQTQPQIAPSPKNDEMMAKILWLFAEEYELSVSDLSILLDVKKRTLFQNQKDRSFPQSSNDRYRRMGLLLGIKKNLEILFPENPEVRKNWLKVPREVFKNKSALELIAEQPVESMARLFTVRRLLDMLRNGTINILV